MNIMEKSKNISPYRLSSLLRLQKDPNLALNLFLNPNPNPNPNKPFNHSPLSYDLIITKLGRAKLFPQLEQIIKMLKKQTRFVPDEIIFCNIIQFYARGKLPDKGLDVFHQIPSFGCERTIKSVNTVLNALLSCREFEKFEGFLVNIGKCTDPDVCTYNILINACCCFGGDLVGAWKVFDEMRKRKISPNLLTFGTLVNGLCANSMLDEAIKLKETMVIDFNVMPNGFVYAPLIKGLCKAGKLNEAVELKDEVLKCSVEMTSSTFASLISELFKAGRKGDVIRLVEELRQKECRLDSVTYNAMISGFCLEKDFDAAFSALHEMEEKGCKPVVITYNVIIGGLCREGRLKEATELFESMSKRECKPDIVTYRMLFDGHCDHVEHNRAASILGEMVLRGYSPRSESITKFLDSLIQGGDLELLWTVISTMVKGNLIDAVTWDTVVSLVCRNNDHSKGSKLVNTLAMP